MLKSYFNHFYTREKFYLMLVEKKDFINQIFGTRDEICCNQFELKFCTMLLVYRVPVNIQGFYF